MKICCDNSWRAKACTLSQVMVNSFNLLFFIFCRILNIKKQSIFIAWDRSISSMSFNQKTHSFGPTQIWSQRAHEPCKINFIRRRQRSRILFSSRKSSLQIQNFEKMIVIEPPMSFSWWIYHRRVMHAVWKK